MLEEWLYSFCVERLAAAPIQLSVKLWITGRVFIHNSLACSLASFQNQTKTKKPKPKIYITAYIGLLHLKQIKYKKELRSCPLCAAVEPGTGLSLELLADFKKMGWKLQIHRQRNFSQVLFLSKNAHDFL